jgi:hypothetical protein
MLGHMSRQVDVGEEDIEPLRELALANGRSFREQGKRYLHIIITQEYAKLLEERAAEQVA